MQGWKIREWNQRGAAASFIRDGLSLPL